MGNIWPKFHDYSFNRFLLIPKKVFFDIFEVFGPANHQKLTFLKKNYEYCLFTLKYI